MQQISLLQVEQVSFRPTPGAISREEREAVGAWWEANKSNFPTAFNGPLLACHAHRLIGDGTLEIDWYATCFAHNLMRYEKEPPARPAGTIFSATVLVTAEGSVVAGEMSAATASAGRVQLPGGVVEIPIGAELSLGACANAARFELAEEVGVKVDASHLELWRVKTGGPLGGVGFLYACRFRASESEVAEAFEQRVRAQRDAGETPEFNRLHFLRDSDLSGMRHVEYLPHVIKDALRGL